MKNTQPSRWTRNGLLHFKWSPFESIERLALNSALRDRLIQRMSQFLQGEAVFHAQHLPWRFGFFLYGPPGSGKTAAGKAMAHGLGWNHLTIPAHEILDSHHFERALYDAILEPHRVIVLEDVDRMIRTMEPEVFFNLLDHALERAEGTLWIATTSHAEDTPKTQLLRPGRFDEAIRMELPSADLRRQLLKDLLSLKEDEWSESEFLEWVEYTQGLSYSHFEEMRQVIVRLRLEGAEVGSVVPSVRSYVEDQMIAGDRWGGLSDSSERLQERVKQIDARVLMAALDMTQVFEKLIEKVIGDAVVQSKTSQLENGVAE